MYFRINNDGKVFKHREFDSLWNHQVGDIKQKFGIPDKHEEDQDLTDQNIELEGNPLIGLIKISTINAQRGFSDANSDNPESNNAKSLSSQLRSYYDTHLNPSIDPSEQDLEAIEKLSDAQNTFDKNLTSSFEAPLKELSELNYPGFGNPQITLSSLIKATDGLEHDSAVRYNLAEGLTLPNISVVELYNYVKNKVIKPVYLPRIEVQIPNPDIPDIILTE